MKAVAFEWIQVFTLADQQLNNSALNYLLKACRECGGSSSGRCQRQRWRRGLENRVILKSSGTVRLVVVTIANRISGTMRKSSEQRKKDHCFCIIAYCSCILNAPCIFVCHDPEKGLDWKEYRKGQSAGQRHSMFSEGRLQRS